ncbi:type II toxin-antitoxin system Phd/YefM family antitoxin [Cellulomonas alba]|uniref:Prevent-host-death protein n=1 Tax=Cellulomonas alba TaxID=3053467 RepID=A0ABT7SDS2_9CELL|nr:hypothetical protein [Cellulomonas alba]MDM7853664.1 hypothetical protein [Cellulomonas alba]
MRLDRELLRQVRWDVARAAQIIEDAGRDVVLSLAPRTSALQPIDLAREPDLRALLEAIDLSYLAEWAAPADRARHSAGLAMSMRGRRSVVWMESIIAADELRERADEVIRRAAAGERFVLTMDGRRVAEITPCTTDSWRTGDDVRAIWTGRSYGALDRDLFGERWNDPFVSE